MSCIKRVDVGVVGEIGGGGTIKMQARGKGSQMGGVHYSKTASGAEEEKPTHSKQRHHPVRVFSRVEILFFKN